MFSVYAEHHNLTSFWIGAFKAEGQWMKSDETELSAYELKFKDNGTGDCVIADAENSFKPKLVSCLESYAVSFLLIHQFCYASKYRRKSNSWKRRSNRTKRLRHSIFIQQSSFQSFICMSQQFTPSETFWSGSPFFALGSF